LETIVCYGQLRAAPISVETGPQSVL